MTLLEVTGRCKLPVWRTVRACYASVLQNLRQLVRISWLWLLIMVPVYAATNWLVSPDWTGTAPRWVREIAPVMPLVVELPFLASIAVAWHRLVLGYERVSASAYLRLDRQVWLYAVCSLGFLVLTTGPFLPVIAVHTQHSDWLLDLDTETFLLAIMLPLVVPSLAAGVFLLPRLSLVLPALALGERLSLWDAWRATRGNTLRLALATCLCMLPALFLVMVLPLLSLLLSEPWLLQASWEWTTWLNFINQLLDSTGYATFSSLTYSLLTILAVTLLSLTYQFFVARSDESRLPPS